MKDPQTSGAPQSKESSTLLLVNGLILGGVALLQFCFDLVGYRYGWGPTGVALHNNLDAIGYTEAHGLAAILGFLLIVHRHKGALWHAIAAVTHLLLGTCNLIFWPLFVKWGLVPMGILATLMHAIFFIVEGMALRRASFSK